MYDLEWNTLNVQVGASVISPYRKMQFAWQEKNCIVEHFPYRICIYILVKFCPAFILFEKYIQYSYQINLLVIIINLLVTAKFSTILNHFFKCSSLIDWFSHLDIFDLLW